MIEETGISQEDFLLALSLYGWKKNRREEYEKNGAWMKIYPIPYPPQFFIVRFADDFWAKFPFSESSLKDGVITVRVPSGEEWKIPL